MEATPLRNRLKSLTSQKDTSNSSSSNSNCSVVLYI